MVRWLIVDDRALRTIDFRCPSFLEGLKGRYRFQDRVVIWKGVKGLYEHLVLALFHVQIADCSVSDSAAGVKGLKQFLVALGSLELGLDHPEHVGRYRFSFAFGGVTNDRIAIDLLIELGPERGRDDSSALR